MKRAAFIGAILGIMVTFDNSFAASDPIVGKIELPEKQVVRGEKAILDLHLFTLSGAVVDLDGLGKANFGAWRLDSLSPSALRPFEAEYFHQRIRLVFFTPEGAGYGFHAVPPLEVPYRITDDGGRTIRSGILRIDPKLKLEIAAFRVKHDVVRDAIRLGERLFYPVFVFHEEGVKVFVDKEKIATGLWKFVDYTLAFYKTGGVRRTSITMVYAYYNLPERMALLPSPVIFVKVPNADRAVEIKLPSVKVMVRSSLGPKTVLQGWEPDPAERKQEWVYSGYGLLGLATGFFLWGVFAIVFSAMRRVRHPLKREVPYESIRRVRRELGRFLARELPADPVLLRNHISRLYCIVQRLMGACFKLDREEALATPADIFQLRAGNSHAGDLAAFLRLEELLWCGRELNHAEILEVKRGIEKFKHDSYRFGVTKREDYTVFPYFV